MFFHDTFVSLKIFSLLGEEVAELAGKNYPGGKHVEEFNLEHLSDGIYFYSLTAGEFSANRTMMVQRE